jgi:tetratricopeptide (TPR) repeat protein
MAAQAEVLPAPQGLRAEAAGGRVSIQWEPVPGAELYRVAVFDAADAEGKRPLLAAVWVDQARWDYGGPAAVARAGGLPSTRPQPLPQGRTLRVMVSAARADGADRSEWAGEDLRLAAAEPTPAPSPSATPEPAIVGEGEADAELELEGGDEFKSSPEPVELVVEEPSAGIAAGAAVGAPASAAPAAAAEAPTAQPSASAAAAFLKAGQAEAAEAQYRALLAQDGADASAWEGLGDALLARRLKAEAHEAYSQALLLDGKRSHLREWIRKNAPRR